MHLSLVFLTCLIAATSANMSLRLPFFALSVNRNLDKGVTEQKTEDVPEVKKRGLYMFGGSLPGAGAGASESMGGASAQIGIGGGAGQHSMSEAASQLGQSMGNAAGMSWGASSGMPNHMPNHMANAANGIGFGGSFGMGNGMANAANGMANAAHGMANGGKPGRPQMSGSPFGDAHSNAMHIAQSGQGMLINNGQQMAENQRVIARRLSKLWMLFRDFVDSQLVNSTGGLTAFGTMVYNLLNRISPLLAGFWNGFHLPVDQALVGGMTELTGFGDSVNNNINFVSDMSGSALQGIRDTVDGAVSSGIQAGARFPTFG